MQNVKKLLKSFKPDYNGLFLIIIGLLMVTGGSFGIKSTIDHEPIWIALPKVDLWVAYFIVWIGIDILIFSGKATTWVIKNTLGRFLRLVIGEDRIERMNKYIEAKFKAKKTEQFK